MARVLEEWSWVHVGTPQGLLAPTVETVRLREKQAVLGLPLDYKAEG